MQVIVEVPEFTKRAEGLLTDQEKMTLIEVLARQPTLGVLLRESGGIRKYRFPRGNKGKSGGVRVVYFYYNETKPLFLLTIFGKSEQSTLSSEQLRHLAKLSKQLIRYYGHKNEH
jgi:hypothetical protein